MTHMLKKQSSTMASPGIPSGSSTLGMHRDSRVISKVQPKIRIIHIFAPEIIKTDVANFRELVQRLTGKPSPDSNTKSKYKGKKTIKRAVLEPTGYGGGEGGMMMGCDKQPTVNTKLEVMNMGPSNTVSSSSPSSSDDQEVWRSSSSGDHHHHHHHHNNNNINTSGGYLTAFTDLDDNFDFSTVFHMGTADGTSHHLNAFGETAQLSFRG